MRGVLAAVLALVAAPAFAAGSPLWTVEVTQFDKSGTMAGAPISLSCPETGCQQLLTLDVSGKPHSFLLGISMTFRGAYVELQAQDREVGQVVEFEKGFVGPVFMATHPGTLTSQTLRYTLTGAIVTDPHDDKLMGNSRSLVFHRKVQPDLALRIDLTPPAPEPPAAASE